MCVNPTFFRIFPVLVILILILIPITLHDYDYEQDFGRFGLAPGAGFWWNRAVNRC